MEVVNIHDAKTRFSKLVEAVSKGEEVIIARAGKPAARLVPMPAQGNVRRPGALKGKMRVADDFNSPLPPDMLEAFEGS